MTITRVGTNEKFATGWEAAFGKNTKKSKTAAKTTKTAAKKKVAKKAGKTAAKKKSKKAK